MKFVLIKIIKYSIISNQNIEKLIRQIKFVNNLSIKIFLN